MAHLATCILYTYPTISVNFLAKDAVLNILPDEQGSKANFQQSSRDIGFRHLFSVFPVFTNRSRRPTCHHRAGGLCDGPQIIKCRKASRKDTLSFHIPTVAASDNNNNKSTRDSYETNDPSLSTLGWGSA